MDYTLTFTTTADQDVALGIAAKTNNETPEQVLTGLVTAALLTLVARQRDGFLNTISTNAGLQTLETLATAAQAAPDPDTKSA